MVRQLSDFFGEFSVRRVIEDARAGAQARFEGRAVIAAAARGAIYTETGTLITGGQRFEAERSYLWHPAGARIAVVFSDGRAFHDFDPEVGGGATEHLCGADMYRGGYDVSQWPAWSVTWDVQGPRKAYQSVTRYIRLARP